MGDWTFFSNHAHVLFVIARHEIITGRDIAIEVGITERFVHKILSDLQEDGYVKVEKDGRSNRYRLSSKKRLRHPVEAHIQIGLLVDFVQKQ